MVYKIINKMAHTYLPVKYIRKGHFSSQRIVEIIDYKGIKFEGLFDECQMLGDSLVEVRVANINKNLATLIVPHQDVYGLYGEGVDGGREIVIEKNRFVCLN